MESVFSLLAVTMLVMINIQTCESQADTLPGRNDDLPNNIAVALDSYHDLTKRDAEPTPKPEITINGNRCDPRAQNGQDKCGYHGTDVSYERKIENMVSCTINAATGLQEYCCAGPCTYRGPSWFWGGSPYWWCRLTDKALGHKWDYCVEGVPHYDLL